MSNGAKLNEDTVGAVVGRRKAHPLRRVVSRVAYTTRYNRPQEGGYHDTLECGHDWYGKRSQGTPDRRRCRECWYQYKEYSHELR